jgi:hypothetical protein
LGWGEVGKIMMVFPMFAYKNIMEDEDMTALSKNFALSEFLVSQTAARFGIKNEPSQSDIDNLKRLATTILQPLRDSLKKPIIISSGYRSPELNRSIGGSRTSAHMLGCAADIHVPGMTNDALISSIRNLKLPIDQVIDEFGQWVHIGITVGRPPRGQYLKARMNGGSAVYSAI